MAEEDPLSPFYGREYSEFEFSETLYNYYIHPQWDNFGSRTLFMKILFVDYDAHLTMIELLGEWNDAIENDIMMIRRNITDDMMDKGIHHFILLADNVLNFHSSDDSYYEDWTERLQENGGWICIINMPHQSQYEFKKARLNHYIELLDLPEWRTLKPDLLYSSIDSIMHHRLD